MVDVLIRDTTDDFSRSKCFEDMDAWAQKHCLSYVGYHVRDVQDIYLDWSEVACYQFREEKDANWFMLRWSQLDK